MFNALIKFKYPSQTMADNSCQFMYATDVYQGGSCLTYWLRNILNINTSNIKYLSIKYKAKACIYTYIYNHKNFIKKE